MVKSKVLTPDGKPAKVTEEVAEEVAVPEKKFRVTRVQVFMDSGDVVDRKLSKTITGIGDYADRFLIAYADKGKLEVISKQKAERWFAYAEEVQG